MAKYLCENCDHAEWDEYMYLSPNDPEEPIILNIHHRIYCKGYGFPQKLRIKACGRFEPYYPNETMAPWGGI